jgi:hypothetical protein
MRKLINRLNLAAALALLGLAMGCASTKHTENLLSAAGFKTVPATTPDQEAHLKALPPHKVTMVIRNGKTYYAFPDVKENVLYIGQDAQYQQYQKLRLQEQLAEDQVSAAEMNSEASWNMWGPWEGFWP